MTMFKVQSVPSHRTISKKRLLFSLLGISFFVFLIFYNTHNPETKEKVKQNFPSSTCYLPGLESTIADLEDMLRSNVTPISGRTIFFHETSCHPPEEKHVLNLTARQACSIESAALHNPNFRVFVLFASYTLLPKNNPILKAILSYKNVYLRQLNIWDYVKDTPIQKWFAKGVLFRSSFLMEHTSDLLRILSLYRYGGIYLDLDVVVQRTMEFIPLNYLGAHDNITLGNAVIGMTPLGQGNKFGKWLLLDFQKRYYPTEYVGNGPSLVTRVLSWFCNLKTVDDMIAKSQVCGFKVFNSTAFYPIDSGRYKMYMDPQYLNDVMNYTKDSYLVHFWNKADHTKRIRLKDGSAYAKIAQKNCPKTIAAAGEYF